VTFLLPEGGVRVFLAREAQRIRFFFATLELLGYNAVS
jgi:hypothetical protein